MATLVAILFFIYLSQGILLLQYSRTQEPKQEATLTRFNVQGVFMRNWDLTNETGHCTVEADREDAAFVCEKLKIPFQEVNFVKEYWNEVFSELIQGYENGNTPNPDVLCNKYVKFGHFFHHAVTTLGGDAVATGHYAQSSWGAFLEKPDPESGARLMTSVDQQKDQTLFLSQISQHALQKTMFPVGGMTKDVVKKMAMSAGLDKIVKKKESTGICFIGKREFQEFIEEYIEPKHGNFIELETGKVVGHHRGLHNWTIGQRTHLSGYNRAYFVADIQQGCQDILVVKGTNHPALYTQIIHADQPHWIHQPPPELYETGSMQCKFRYQHVHPLTDCSITLNNGSLEIRIDRPLRAIAKGQYAVLYQDEECLGSARIFHTGPSLYELDMKDPVKNSKEFS